MRRSAWLPILGAVVAQTMVVHEAKADTTNGVLIGVRSAFGDDPIAVVEPRYPAHKPFCETVTYRRHVHHASGSEAEFDILVGQLRLLKDLIDSSEPARDNTRAEVVEFRTAYGSEEVPSGSIHLQVVSNDYVFRVRLRIGQMDLQDFALV